MRCLVDLGLMRDAGEGILRMYAKMEEQRLPAPEFDSSTHRMVVKLRNRGESASDGREPEPVRRELEPDRRELEPDRRELLGEDEGLTEEEQRLVEDLGARPRREKLWITILVLLGRRPWRPVDLAKVLNHRNTRRLAEQHLSPMLEAGLIRRTEPEKPTAPDQDVRTIRPTAPDARAGPGMSARGLLHQEGVGSPPREQQVPLPCYNSISNFTYLNSFICRIPWRPGSRRKVLVASKTASHSE